MKIRTQRVVTLVYRLQDSKGRIISQALSDDPISYLHGTQKLFGRIDEHLSGLSPNSEVTLSIAPSSGYGTGEKERRFSIPRNIVPHTNALYRGLPLRVKMNGRFSQYWVLNVDDDQVFLDGNHPLSGEHLTAWVWILSVRKSSKEEIETGRALFEEKLKPEDLGPA